MSVYSLSRFIYTDVDMDNYPTLVMRVREASKYSPETLVAYMFKRGDSIRLLAYKFYGTPLVWWAILDANPQYQNELEIQVGDILNIPAPQEVADYV